MRSMGVSRSTLILCLVCAYLPITKIQIDEAKRRQICDLKKIQQGVDY